MIGSVILTSVPCPGCGESYELRIEEQVDPTPSVTFRRDSEEAHGFCTSCGFPLGVIASALYAEVTSAMINTTTDSPKEEVR